MKPTLCICEYDGFWIYSTSLNQAHLDWQEHYENAKKGHKGKVRKNFQPISEEEYQEYLDNRHDPKWWDDKINAKHWKE